jgi:hypothetical protein
MLHLTKVAVGAATLDLLAARLAERAAGGEVTIATRHRPTRHAELVGGSLYWIIRHRLVARQTILGFGTAEDGRCAIRLAMPPVPVRTMVRRAHQGWRYLAAADAPPDRDGGDGIDELPPALRQELDALALL